jgi:murein DD-endopeptidase MepM/ murein hydrolase activator NlpD
MKRPLAITLTVLAITGSWLATRTSLFAHAEGETAVDTTTSTATAKAELEARIQAKSDALTKLNSDLAAKQLELSTTQSQRVSLQRDLAAIQTNIASLKISIQADQVTSEKLGLEIDSLTYDIKDIELAIDHKNASIANLITTIYHNDSVSPLITFLKTASISETIDEAQAIIDTKKQLKSDVESLADLHTNSQNKLNEVSEKKTEVELRNKNQVAKKAIVEDQQQTRTAILAQTKNKESEYQKEVSDLTKQQDSLEDEIQDIEDQLRTQFDPSLAPAKIGGALGWPVTMVSTGGIGRITQHFGEKSYLYRGKAHNGLDIGVPIGTPVYAAEDGIVTAADNNDQSKTRKYQYGKYVLIRHPNNLTTIYGHLSSQVVKSGAVVKRGQLIGYSGSTGYATGPHVHFGVYWTNSVELKSIPPAAGLVPVGVTLNPEDYL